MSSLLEQIREGNRIRRMRIGQNAADFVSLRSNPEVRVALVPLLEREVELAWEQAAVVDVPDNVYGTEVRDRILKRYQLYYAVRDPENIEERLFESADDLADNLSETDINHLAEQYLAMVDYSSPALDGLDDAKLGELKKALETIDLSVLSGKAWWHLKAFFMTLTVEELRASSRSRSSILSLIGRSESDVFTPGAEND